MFFKGKRERTREWLLISGFTKPTLILLWEFEDEGKEQHQLPGLFPSPHAAQQAVKSTEVRVRKLGNVPWAPREEIRNKGGFPQFMNTVSRLCGQGCVCILRAVSSVWVLQEADIKTHQGLDLQRCTGECQWRINGKLAAVGRESLENTSRKKGRRIEKEEP